MTPDRSHLDALELRLSHEREYLRSATRESERALRRVWIQQIEREIEGEKRFLKIRESAVPVDLSDDELLAELRGGATE